MCLWYDSGMRDAGTPTLERVHHESGRIDARKVARLYDLTLPQLAAVIEQSYETLRKRPDRDEAQPKLAILVHAWNELGDMLPEASISPWLHHPLPRDGRRPIDILRGSEGINEFRELVDSMHAGGYA